ncbi:MAG: 2-oxoglutarate dehydrogenase complex dihydrolipoyllysine-residue succinyltransferase [Acidobacteria bacterium]|nr:2-oxoglutarate dehydrogenase complex dihydrolipoyllysine-residue succinyltransferase [Acidobacteriota bacterium]
MTYEVTIPEIGESITEALIVRWIKQPGDAIGRDEPLVELETDKVTVEMPCPVAGVVSELVCAEGETVPIGAVIARIEEGAAAAAGPAATPTVSTQTDLLSTAEPAPPPAPAPVVQPVPAPATPATAPAAGASTEEPRRILPAAQRVIAEHGLDAAVIPATGKGGRLLKSDVIAYLTARDAEAASTAAPATEPAPAPPVGTTPAPPPTPKPALRTQRRPAREAPAAPAAGRAEERVTMTPIRRRIAERLVESQQQAALLTTFNEIDMSAVIDFRRRYRDDFEKRHDVRLGFLSFFVKAVVDALRQCPRLNAEIDGPDIIYRNYYDVGIAVSTDRGLMVPVLRSAERLSFAEIEAQIADFAGRARAGRIRIDELQGGTFTITNGGVFGSLLSTPIINPPQSGVLGLHAIQERPMVVDGEIVVRPMMYVALTYDHRIVDGREAVTFLVRIKEAVQDPARMLVEV